MHGSLINQEEDSVVVNVPHGRLLGWLAGCLSVCLLSALEVTALCPALNLCSHLLLYSTSRHFQMICIGEVGEAPLRMFLCLLSWRLLWIDLLELLVVALLS